MKAYKIDYEYGTAVLITKEPEKEPLDLFYDLAYQCFGIRKSIGEVKLLGEEEVNLDKVELPEDNSLDNHPELDNPLQRMMNAMGKRFFTIPRELEEKAKYILIHSGGDLIAWSDKDTKIKSEFDN
jgi:hypothetical protein